MTLDPCSEPEIVFIDDRPPNFRIFAIFNTRQLGNFVTSNVVAATIKLQFKDSLLFVYYRNDRPFKENIIKMNPHIDFAIKARETGKPLPLEVFDNFGNPGFELNHELWKLLDGRRSELILPDKILRPAFLPGFKRRARFRIPDELVEGLTRRLVAHGVNPDRWFSCVFWREASYTLRPPSELRDTLDPTPYHAMIDYIVRERGGQVVRLGHPEMSPLPAQDCVIDLSGVEDGALLHAFAVSRARFMVSGPAGPITFGSSFGTPTAAVDASDLEGVWNEHDTLVTRTFIGPEGRIYRQLQALDAGFFLTQNRRRFLYGDDAPFKIKPCNATELISAASAMYSRTDDVSGWRQSDGVDNGQATVPNFVQFPLRPAIHRQSWV